MQVWYSSARSRTPCQSNSVAQFRTFAPARQVHASRLRLRCTGTTRHKRKPASCVARSFRHFTFVPVATSPLDLLSKSFRPAGSLARSASGRRLRADHPQPSRFPSLASTPLKEARPPLPLRSVPPSPVTARNRLHITHKPLSSLSISRLAILAYLVQRADRYPAPRFAKQIAPPGTRTSAQVAVMQTRQDQSPNLFDLQLLG